MIRRLVVAAAAPVVAAVGLGPVLDRIGRRMTGAPRRAPGEAALAPALDALGGEVVRMRSRDGLRLAGRWLPAEAVPEGEGPADWRPDPREAVLVLHGWSGSVGPDLVEYAPFLRRTANVLGLDLRGHGDSDDAPTTFGMREVEDVAGALAWLGERGIARVALFGTSMGGMTAIAAVGVLGDGRLASADLDPDAPASPGPPPRPRIVGIVADSVAPELAPVIGRRLRVPFGRFVASRAIARAARGLGGDMRETEPLRMVGLLEDVPLLLVHGTADPAIPVRAARRLAAAAPSARHLLVEGAGHAGAHATDPGTYAAEVGAFLRAAFTAARPDAEADGSVLAGPTPILSGDTPPGDAHQVASDGASG